MSPGAYYNEIDPVVAQWLRNLIQAGHIAPGDVDERSILDVSPDDLRGYRQCHFFAGIGVWSYALRRAGWPDDREIWSGSCPCQPFSVAGVGGGFDDERHLWPFFFHLIEQRRPAAVVGEQVAGRDGLGWLDLVQTDLEGAGYAVGKAVLSAAGYGAPHIRERIFLVADAKRAGQPGPGKLKQSLHPAQDPHREASGFVNALRGGTLPYVCGRHDGPSNGVEQLRAYGNAINAEQAVVFLEAVMPSLS